MAKGEGAQEATSSELAVRDRRIDDEDLASITSIEDAVRILDSYDAPIEDFSDYGTGFEILENKDQLVDKPILILEWRFNPSKEFGGEFVSAVVMTRKGEKFIINDGGTGIARQLRAVTNRRVAKGHPTPTKGLTVEKGLRKSTYTTVININGEDKEIEGTTYYLG